MLDRTATSFSHVKPTDTAFRGDGLQLHIGILQSGLERHARRRLSGRPSGSRLLRGRGRLRETGSGGQHEAERQSDSKHLHSNESFRKPGNFIK